MPKGHAKNGKRKPPRKYTRRGYHDHERFAAITLAKEIGVASASETMSIPAQTIYSWLNGFSSPHTLQLYNLTRGDLASVFENLAWDALSAARDKLDDATFSELIRAMGIAIEKAQLLREKPTNIHNNTMAEEFDYDLSRLTSEQRHILEELLATARVAR